MPLIGPVSGSHTHLSNGSSFLVAGSNITISSGSGDNVTIAASGGGGISFDGSTANGVLTFKDSDEATVESSLTFDGTDLGVAAKVFHVGDADTYMDFTTTDQIEFVAGGVDMIHITEDDSQDMIVFNEGGADVDFRVESSSEDEAIFLNAGADELHINKGKSAFATHIYSNNDNALEVNTSGVTINESGHAGNDFRVETDNKTHGLFVDAGNDRVLILSGGATTSTNSAAKSDVVFFVSGAVGGKTISKTGVTVFGGDLVSSGIMYASNVQVGDSGVGFPMATALNVYANVSSDFAAKIDNDQSSEGHILKLTTDGNGSGTTMMAMEDGDGDTLFKARADGRFGFGASGVSSMGAGTFVVGIDGGHTSDIAISKRLQHLGDSNTYMDFPAADQIEFVAGGVDMIHMTEDGSQDMIVFNEGGADVDFRIESNNKTHALFIDGSTDQVLILSGGASASTNEAAGTDVNFFVSGTVGSRNSSNKGTSVFGGDAVVSGTLYAGSSVTVDHLTITESEIDVADGNLTLDVAGDIVLDADGDNIYFDAGGVRIMSIANVSTDVVLAPAVANKDLILADQGDNNIVTVDSSASALKINRNLGVDVNTITSNGALSATTPLNKIINATGSDITGGLPNPTFEGQIQMVLGLQSSSGNCIVTYLNAAGGTTTKTLTNGIGITLISFDATGAGAYRWCPVGDVS